jgi:hypothetical protein
MAESPKITETFSVDNPYTLSVIRREEAALSTQGGRPIETVSELTRSFNFAARQVTTCSRDYLYQVSVYDYPGFGGVSSTLNIQNFDDVPAPDEIIAMHKKLVELGGTPPALDAALNTLSKPRALAPGVKS